jgi:lactate dehydrogenase-like 2-hydroxyacid dehydrogenase
MVAALEEGKIAAVGLDVYENEPEVNPRLMRHEKALLVPHLGTHTTETLDKMERLAMENARRGCTGKELLTVVPELVGLYKSFACKDRHCAPVQKIG